MTEMTDKQTNAGNTEARPSEVAAPCDGVYWCNAHQRQ